MSCRAQAADICTQLDEVPALELCRVEATRDGLRDFSFGELTSCGVREKVSHSCSRCHRLRRACCEGALGKEQWPIGVELILTERPVAEFLWGQESKEVP